MEKLILDFSSKIYQMELEITIGIMEIIIMASLLMVKDMAKVI